MKALTTEDMRGKSQRSLNQKVQLARVYKGGYDTVDHKTEALKPPP